MLIEVICFERDTHAKLVCYTTHDQKKVFAFLPRTFFGGEGLGSFWAATRADTRARVA